MALTMSRILVALFSIFSCVSCSGYLEIRIQSDFRLDATVTITHGGNETVIALPIGLRAGKERRLGSFPIEFANNYDLTIVGGRVEQLGINQSSYTSHFEPVRGTLSPKQLHLPFNGLELVFECDENWSGPKCDVACGKDCHQDRQNLTMELSTDYTVDITKLPEIVKRLKETTKVDNQLRKKEEEKKVEKNDEKEDNWRRRTLEKDERPKSIFQDLFKTILSLKDRLAESSENIDAPPIQIKVKMDMKDGFTGISTSDTERESEEEESKSEDRSPFAGLPMDPMSMINEIMSARKEKKKKEDHSEEIGKHSSMQKLFGMKHAKPPTSFNSMDGPGGMGSLPMFGSLMKMMPLMSMMSSMPRTVRHTSAEQPILPEGSGANDFEMDQIIKTRSP